MIDTNKSSPDDYTTDSNEKDLSRYIPAKAFMGSFRVPHPVPYQGSKRALAPAISRFVSEHVRTLYEPFAGSAAFTLYAAAYNMADRFILNDALEPLIELWKLIVEKPDTAAAKYRLVWLGQKKDDLTYFNQIREQFNESRDPILLLYLVARCVKNAVRFNKDGRFTQSVDKRRVGMHPDKMANNIKGASALLSGRTEFYCSDFAECVSDAGAYDLVYMDPPYQGTTYGRDKRYFSQVERHNLYEVLRNLQARNVSFLLSYDGMTGDKRHGEELPIDLKLKRFFLNAGRSSQATLNGEEAVTVESLYVWGSVTKAGVPVAGRSADIQMPLPF